MGSEFLYERKRRKKTLGCCEMYTVLVAWSCQKVSYFAGFQQAGTEWK